MNPQPRPALRKAPDADVHPAFPVTADGLVDLRAEVIVASPEAPTVISAPEADPNPVLAGLPAHRLPDIAEEDPTTLVDLRDPDSADRAPTISGTDANLDLPAAADSPVIPDEAVPANAKKTQGKKVKKPQGKKDKGTKASDKKVKNSLVTHKKAKNSLVTHKKAKDKPKSKDQSENKSQTKTKTKTKTKAKSKAKAKATSKAQPKTLDAGKPPSKTQSKKTKTKKSPGKAAGHDPRQRRASRVALNDVVSRSDRKRLRHGAKAKGTRIGDQVESIVADLTSPR